VDHPTHEIDNVLFTIDGCYGLKTIGGHVSVNAPDPLAGLFSKYLPIFYLLFILFLSISFNFMIENDA